MMRGVFVRGHMFDLAGMLLWYAGPGHWVVSVQRSYYITHRRMTNRLLRMRTVIDRLRGRF
jgi:hypothetical protein